MNEEQTIPQPQPRGGQQKWPDFTEEQKAILLEIANTPAYCTKVGYAWRLAFKEHPEWEQILLKDQSRPMSHLWHASKELQNGGTPARPFTYIDTKRKNKRRKVALMVVKRGKYKKRVKWPGIEAMQRRKAEIAAEKLAEKLLPDSATFSEKSSPVAGAFCPHCGSHRSHFGNQA